MRSLMSCSLHQILLVLTNQEELEGQSMQHVWRVERCIQGLVRKREGMRLLRRPGLNWDYNIKLDVHKQDEGHGLDSSGIGQGQVTCSDKCGSESPFSITFGEILRQMRTCCIFNKDFAPWNQLVGLLVGCLVVQLVC